MWISDLIEYFHTFKTIDKIALFILALIFLKIFGYFLDFTTVNKRRRNTPCFSDDEISESTFNNIVSICTQNVPRLVDYSVSGAVVLGEVISQSEKSTWNFRIDFNDYGHVDGCYWLSSGNHQSDIPRRLANEIGGLIQYELDRQGNTQPRKHNRNTGYKAVRRRAKRDRRRIIWTPIIVCLELAFLLCGSHYIWHLYNGYIKSIPVGVSSNALMGINYLDAEKELIQSGFSDIQYVPRGDVECILNNRQYCTCEVKINGVASFIGEDLFPSDSKIELIYYEFDGVYPPVSYWMKNEMDYIDLEQAFKDAGFENVKMEGIQDVNLFNPWSYGEISEITIDNRTDFDTSTPFRKDAEVVIVYHVY